MKKNGLDLKRNMDYQLLSHPLCMDSTGDYYYCRAVHGILSEKEDGFFCGAGCPCLKQMEIVAGKERPICIYYDFILRNKDKAKFSASQMYEYIQTGIRKGYFPLFPETAGISAKLKKAYAFAASAHAGQLRKGKKMPYMTHLILTLDYVSQLTENEDVWIAALLHDTIEDTKVTKEEIESVFGSYVAALVSNESEDKMRGQDPTATWEIRKKTSLNRLKNATIEAKMIALGDKTANLRSLAKEKILYKDQVWSHFNQSDVSKQKWYYTSCKEALMELKNSRVMKIFDDFYSQVFLKN